MANFTFMLPCIVIDFFLNNQPGAPIIQIYSVIKLYMFRASSLPIIRSFLLYIRHWRVSCRFLKTFSKQSQDGTAAQFHLDSAWKSASGWLFKKKWPTVFCIQDFLNATLPSAAISDPSVETDGQI
jgi:hypothetical protein